MAAGKILPYLDIPFQHASPRILKAMKRPGDIDDTLTRIRGWREAVPELALRSTFIVGFPGETEHDFQRLLDFLDEAQLDRVGAFAYSPVAGAAANALPDPVPETVKQERLARFMEKQTEISAHKLEAKIGRELTVLVDEITDDGTAIARSPADAPEIDGVVIIENGERLEVGEFTRVTVTDSGEHDLWAEPTLSA
jgi:ribosomal protein S12 methylthiotransferase